jgi:hypothetical protein
MRSMNIMHGQASRLILSGLATLGIALSVRYGLVEPQGMATACAVVVDTSCAMRDMAIAIFTHQRLGYLALAAALLALMLQSRPLAWTGWVAGIAGLVLYCFELSAPSALLALLVLARPAKASSKHSTSQA